MSKRAAEIHDREAGAGKEPKRPQVQPERQRYDAAVLLRDEIGRRLRLWSGARAGAEYEALLADWKAAGAKADAAFDAMIAASREAPDAA